MIDLDADATELARRVRDGEVKATELVDAAIKGIEAVNPQLNAVVHAMYDSAREAAKNPLPGPFSGVPAVVKDFDGFVKDVPYTASCRFLEGFIPDHDAENIARLRRSGLVFLAKTNCPELAILGTTEPAWRGPTRNPWNTDHSVGGSSGGSAALVAAGAVPVGHGGDGGGSLRIPGSACGLVGFKASRGRISLAPDQGEGWGGYVQTGVLVRSVRDAAAFLDILSGPMPGDPYAAPPPARPFIEEVSADPGKLRIAMSTRSLFGKNTDPECVKAVEDTAKLLESLGHHVEEATPPFDRDRLVKAYLVQVGVGIAAEIEEFAKLTGRKPSASYFEPATWFLRQVGLTMTALELQDARDAIHEAARKMGGFFQTYDLFLLPTLAHPPVRIGQLAPKPAELTGLSVLRALPLQPAIRAVLAKLAADNFERTPNTQLFNQTGQPAVSLPLHVSADGLPIGVQLAARYGDEATLLRISAQLEAARPWAKKRPKIHVAQ
jgi:amidase